MVKAFRQNHRCCYLSIPSLKATNIFEHRLFVAFSDGKFVSPYPAILAGLYYLSPVATGNLTLTQNKNSGQKKDRLFITKLYPRIKNIRRKISILQIFLEKETHPKENTQQKS